MGNTLPMLLNPSRLIEMYCQVDDFVASFERLVGTSLIGTGPESPHSVNGPSPSHPEMMTIEIMCHLSGYKCFGYYYHQAVGTGCLRAYSPKAPSYSRSVQLKPRILATGGEVPTVLQAGDALWVVLCRFHCYQGLQQQAHTRQQGLQGHGGKGQGLNGMVLWF